MATMVKEKRREKKKPKERHTAKTGLDDEHVATIKINEVNKEHAFICTDQQNSGQSTSDASHLTQAMSDKIYQKLSTEAGENIAECLNTNTSTSIMYSSDKSLKTELVLSGEEKISSTITEIHDTQSVAISSLKVEQPFDNAFAELNTKLGNISIPCSDPNIDTTQLEQRLQLPHAYLEQTETKDVENSSETLENVALATAEQNFSQNIHQDSLIMKEVPDENVTPSAPVFEEEITPYHQEEHRSATIKVVTPKLQCMSLEEAVRFFGGKEIEEIRVMAEREEALVEAGPTCGPEHPLVDLLSTFRSSLKAVDRERAQLISGFIEEEKFRHSLWKIEKRKFSVTEKCSCDANVYLKGVYEHAEFNNERLPVARLRLEGLMRTLQESFCHHQHSALLAYCQIEELISETTKSSKGEIRQALALVLQALRAADSGPGALCAALQRWALALAAAMVDHRDHRQLVHLIHHLFRQTRSVHWAAKVITFNVTDMSSAARALAILDLMLSKTRLEPATECTEEELWEEVDVSGSGSAVSDGSVRERDLVAMVRALPMRALLARVSGLPHSDVRSAHVRDWLMHSPAMLRSCCAVRVLLAVCARAMAAHVHYARLRRLLRSLATHALHCLASQHLHCRSSYDADYKDKISAELEACFAAGVAVLEPAMLYRLPATLLSDDTAKEYCVALMAGLHDSSPKTLSSGAIRLPAVQCAVAVRMVAQAAWDRTCDHELARMVLEFLAQIGIKHTASPCAAACVPAARKALPTMLAAHPYLHTMAFHILADLYQAEVLDHSALEPLSAGSWRPSTGEVRAVLDDWAQRCRPMVQCLLLALDYTPHTGVSLECQLAIGSWLCNCKHQHGDAPEWAWLVLRRLNVHRATWGLPLDAPDPEEEPQHSFGSAYAVLSTSWGHCVPLICSSGVRALSALAAVRVCEAVHCLATLMPAMAHSPHSISYTPQFLELVRTLLRCGPSVVQRALGLGPPSGHDLLLRAILPQLDGARCQPAVMSAWLHLLWAVSLESTPGAAPALLDTLMLCCRHWQLYDAHASQMLQQSTGKQQISSAVRIASTAPLLCEVILRCAHTHYEAHTHVHARLLDALHRQRLANERIHVDNALKQMGVAMTSEELVIHRSATAVLSAPLDHPSHLTLWRLLMHLYLQRPLAAMHESTPPVGPLFFSGLIKSRVLTQLRSRLAETAKYHHSEMETLKNSQQDNSQRQSTSSTKSHTKVDQDNCQANNEDILPVLSIRDLTGESSDSSELESSSDEESEEDSEIRDVKSEEVDKVDVLQMISYHAAAEKMVSEFSRWLDEGDKTRAMPHHADIARFIPQPALLAAWNSALCSRRPRPSTEPPRVPPTPARAPAAPLQATVARLMKIKDRTGRTRKPIIESRIDSIDFRNTRQVLRNVDQHLAEIQKSSSEWASEVKRLATLDAQLWGLVTALRVERALPPVRKSCANGCKPVTIVVPASEWCISVGAAQGVADNRQAARAAMRRLARPRAAAHAAHSAARLHSIAREVSSVECALAVAELVWSAADRGDAHDALLTTVHALADRWLCQSGMGRVCAELIGKWCNRACNVVQQAMLCALVQPRTLADHWPMVYSTLLKASQHLPSHALFSCLSKFEMSRCSKSLDQCQRRQLLEELVSAAQRWGPVPGEEHLVLLELLGVHLSSALSPETLPSLSLQAATCAGRRSLPALLWPHIVTAAEKQARHVPFDQLGHLLRELGSYWWSVRSALTQPELHYGAHAQPIAALLHCLLRAFAAAAVNMSYASERVSWYVWSALQECWGPWVCPHGSAVPLLPSTVEHPEHYTTMVQLFVSCLLQLMMDCPGTEEYLLRHTFEWAIQTYSCTNALTMGCSQECGVQLSALLVELTALPWPQHQWPIHNTLLAVAQICESGDKEILSWCSATWRNIRAETWLRGIEDSQIASALATILYVFTTAPQHPQTLSEACLLPWHYLPEETLAAALERYFCQHHSPAHPYHDLPHFSLVLCAAECSPLAPAPSPACPKRGLLVSQWTRAAIAPPLHAHVPQYCQAILDVLTRLAPHIEDSEGEIEDLLSRAMIIMSIEPAAASALPEWQRWVRAAPRRLMQATLTAAGRLTTLPYFAAVADQTLEAYLKCTESRGWSEAIARWQWCHWREVAPLAAGAHPHLHAAYVVGRTHAQNADQWRAVFVTIMAADINFIAKEAIVAVWICAACRVAMASGCSGAKAGAKAGAEAECFEAARALLGRWAEAPRRPLLRMVTLTADATTPTAHHRLLSRLALCVLSSTSDSVRAYEAACTAVLGSNPGDVLHWGKQPHPKRLVRLAMRLFPNHDNYFKDELELVPDDS